MQLLSYNETGRTASVHSSGEEMLTRIATLGTVLNQTETKVYHKGKETKFFLVL